MNDIKYEKGNWYCSIVLNKSDRGMNLFVGNKEYQTGFKVFKKPIEHLLVTIEQHSSIFGTSENREERKIYDEDTVYKEVLELGISIVDFMYLIEKEIRDDAENNAQKIASSLIAAKAFEIKDYKG